MVWVLRRRTVLAMMTLSGAWPRSAPVGARDNRLLGDVLLRDHNVDPSGRSSSVAAFTAALAAGRRVMGTPGDVYLLDAPVVVPAGREIIGNGATIEIAHGVVGLNMGGDGCRVSGWSIRSRGGLYAVLNTGNRNEFSNNLCVGDIGHFFFCLDAEHVTVTDNQVDGMTADREITTAIVVENSRYVTVSRNRFEQIPVGWGVQVRKGSSHFAIAENSFLQTQWSDGRVATAGQRTFTFMLGSACLLKKIQIDGTPLSAGYTISGAGPVYTVTFERGRRAGETVRLVGYRGAENIQIATGSNTGSITGNVIDGTGDSGIICYGPRLTVAGNTIRNCGYAGVAIYGDQDHILVANNTIADCAQMDDGLSSPDNPRLASVFAGAILVSGEDAAIRGNTITNASGTMRYAIRINKADMALRTDGRATITIAGNTFAGDFADGRISAPNQTTSARINSVAVDGPLVAYPSRIDLDQPWIHAPPGGQYFRTGGFGRVWAVRDTAIKMGGVASLRTIAGEYLDIALSAAAILRDCNVTVSFWAKATSGSSYVSIFTELEGLAYPLTAEITSGAWRRYVISFPLTAKLTDIVLIRCGATSGSANIQHILITGHRL